MSDGRWTSWARKSGNLREGWTLFLGGEVRTASDLSEEEWREYAFQEGAVPLTDTEALNQGRRTFEKLRQAKDPDEAIRKLGRLPGREAQLALAHALLYVKQVDPKPRDAA